VLEGFAFGFVEFEDSEPVVVGYVVYYEYVVVGYVEGFGFVVVERVVRVGLVVVDLGYNVYVVVGFGNYLDLVRLVVL
jgi:hypothetical protein